MPRDTEYLPGVQLTSQVPPLRLLVLLHDQKPLGAFYMSSELHRSVTSIVYMGADKNYREVVTHNCWKL